MISPEPVTYERSAYQVMMVLTLLLEWHFNSRPAVLGLLLGRLAACWLQPRWPARLLAGFCMTLAMLGCPPGSAASRLEQPLQLVTLTVLLCSLRPPPAPRRRWAGLLNRGREWGRRARRPASPLWP